MLWLIHPMECRLTLNILQKFWWWNVKKQSNKKYNKKSTEKYWVTRIMCSFNLSNTHFDVRPTAFASQIGFKIMIYIKYIRCEIWIRDLSIVSLLQPQPLDQSAASSFVLKSDSNLKNLIFSVIFYLLGKY